ncbi:coiled-coil domain-containing protein mad1 [Yamadazyma tenuis]|uniref:coiled-coil domain-containing protein mad1 n=1 Tax=Candida tenuis TaxID=2315449 RepID=UPI0027A3B6A1|nr:coiled-coil domain-containing protein mad1 [Yamadazyma tenuis]
MSELSSSPLRDVVLHAPGGNDDENTVVNLRQVIYNLRHQISNLKTENKLLQQSNKSLTSKYEGIVTEKNDRIHKLEDDFEYLYSERESLKSLSSNTQQVNDTKVQELQQKNKELIKDRNKLQEQLDEVDESVFKLNSKYQKTKSDLEYTVELNEQFEDRLACLENDNNQLLKYNDELIKKLEEFSKNAKSNDMSKFNESLHLKTISLQRTNNQLQLKLDRLLQNKTSNELLRQKNLGLMNKLRDYNQLEEKYSKLEIQKIGLENKYAGFVKLLNSSDQDDASFTEFVDSYNHLKNTNLILEEKLSSLKNELNGCKTNLMEIEYQISSEWQPNIDKLRDENQAKDEVISKLETQIKLNSQEVEFLRSSLTKMEKINLQNQKEAVQKSTDEYLTNLEKLVDDYKTEISGLQQKVKSQKEITFDIGNKRPKIDDVYRRRSEIELSTIQNENTKLKTQIKDFANQIEVLNTQNANLTVIDSKVKQLHILQLKSNPFNKDQIVKQSTLDALKKENQDLIDKFVSGSEEITSIPRSVFERQELDYSQLEAKFEDLLKRNQRLKQSFTKKARDILTNISKFFGFTIEFLESSVNSNDVGSKIKLTSKYTNTPDLNNSYIILDLSKKSLKAYGNQEFKNFCRELLEEWANDKDQVACILSALNIKLYQKYVLNA